jgi:hypothetical protein
MGKKHITLILRSSDMAETTTCPKCGNVHNSFAESGKLIPRCPSCFYSYFGAPVLKNTSATPKPANHTKLSTYVLGGLFSVFVATYVSLKIESKNKKTLPQPYTKQTIEKPPATPQPTWVYQTIEDKMGRGAKYLAYTESLNTIEFDFPYQGSQKASLVIRRDPNQAFKILLVLKTAHFLCHEDCAVLTRFDDGAPTQYPAYLPDDRSTNIIFISGGLPFIEDVKQSKKLAIEALFFKSGTRIFEFEVDGLKFDTSYHP